MTTNSHLHHLERKVAMSRLAQAIQSRHEINRTRRELNRAMANATTPAMRDELSLVAQRGGNDF
jgi:HAMP domain-containing protein